MVAGERIGYLPPSALRWGHVNDNEGREVARIKDIGWARCYVADIEPSLADLCARWPLSRASSARRTALVRAAASSAADSVHAASHESGRAPPVALWAIGNAAVGLAELSLRAGARPAVSLGAAVTGSRERQRVSAICAPRDNDSPLHLASSLQLQSSASAKGSSSPTADPVGPARPPRCLAERQARARVTALAPIPPPDRRATDRCRPAPSGTRPRRTRTARGRRH
jgi:hypothetical protein